METTPLALAQNALAGDASSVGTPGAAPAVALVEPAYATNLSSSAVSFADSLARAAAPEGPSAIGQAMFEPLGQIDDQAQSLAEYAEQAILSGNELTPSEIVTLTAKSHEFMFRAQLTTNMANRTADGLQQLFRQQG